MSARFPHARHMLQPEVAGLNVNGALCDVVLNIGIGSLVLRSDVFKGEFVGCFRRSKEGAA